jgi:hypothetical protein
LSPIFDLLEISMLKPSAALSRILSLLLLPPAATASSSVHLTKAPATTIAFYASSAPVAAGGDEDDHQDRDGSQSLRILRPKPGQTITDTTTVKALVRVGEGIRPKSLRVTLNGKNITRHLQRDQCREDGCKWIVELNKADGLLSGQNQLVAGARGLHGSVKLARVKFNYSYGLGDGQNQPNYLPSTVGLSLRSAGAQPWVSLTTGTPASLQDNSDTTKYSLPYPDTTLPTAKDTPCTTKYQIVVLNRQNPTVEDAYWCANTSASLKSQLATLNQGTELALVGTTEGNSADATLDTTSIGGTNYSAANSWQPMGYAAIGVSGAAPGSAYESYFISTDLGNAYQTNPFANGFLAVDVNGNYNFHAGDILQFEVEPSPGNGSALVAINYGGTVHDWVSPAGSNGFWLLTLDRVTLLPIDATNDSSSPCQAWGPASAQTCGQFYPTGSTDSSQAAEALLELALDLKNRDSRQLAVLTSLGQPFQSGTSGAQLVSAVNQLGGAGYLLPQLTTSTSTYTLIAPGLVQPGGNALALTPFSRGVVNSSSAFSQQGQTGIVRGVMARDNNSLYFPSVVSQEDGLGNAQGATSLSINYDFYSISTQNAVDWPLTDTTGHIAAYHWASGKFLTNHYQMTGPNSEDLRYSYAGHPDMGQYNTDFQCPNSQTNSSCDYPGDGYGFTAQDLADANSQLYAELTALNDTYNYLGDPGIGGVIKGNSGVPSVSGQVIDATYEVLNGQVGATGSTPVGASASSWMNLMAAVATIGAAGLGPLDMPVAAAAIGVTSGALWTGAALASWPGGTTPPSYYNTFDTTLSDLQNNADQYAINLTASYDTALDNIYSDWGKLSATGAKTADSSSGWQFNNQLTSLGLGDKLAAGVRRSMYLQLLPQFYSLDMYSQQPVSDIDKLGMFSSTSNYPVTYGWTNVCTPSYPTSISSWGWSHFSNPSVAGTSDYYVMGGTINNQGTMNVSETLPTDMLLNTLFSAPTDGDQSVTGPLNIPYDLIYGTLVLPDRQGPSQGIYYGVSQCYKPGCTDTTFSNPGTSSGCINP